MFSFIGRGRSASADPFGGNQAASSSSQANQGQANTNWLLRNRDLETFKTSPVVISGSAPGNTVNIGHGGQGQQQPLSTDEENDLRQELSQTKSKLSDTEESLNIYKKSNVQANLSLSTTLEELNLIKDEVLVANRKCEEAVSARDEAIQKKDEYAKRVEEVKEKLGKKNEYIEQLQGEKSHELKKENYLLIQTHADDQNRIKNYISQIQELQNKIKELENTMKNSSSNDRAVRKSVAENNLLQREIGLKDQENELLNEQLEQYVDQKKELEAVQAELQELKGIK